MECDNAYRSRENPYPSRPSWNTDRLGDSVVWGVSEEEGKDFGLSSASSDLRGTNAKMYR